MNGFNTKPDGGESSGMGTLHPRCQTHLGCGPDTGLLFLLVGHWHARGDNKAIESTASLTYTGVK